MSAKHECNTRRAPSSSSSKANLLRTLDRKLNVCHFVAHDHILHQAFDRKSQMSSYQELTSKQLTKILTTDTCTRNKFLGIFSIDTLPDVVKFPSCLIFNTDPHDKPGQHWIAVYFYSNKKCEFFDPLGFSPSFYGLKDYFDSYSHFVYNKKQIQPFYSRKCGYYCFVFLLFRCRNQKFSLSEKILQKYFNV